MIVEKTDYCFGIKARNIYDYVLSRGKQPAIASVELPIQASHRILDNNGDT